MAIDVVPLNDDSSAAAETSKKRLFLESSDEESDSRPANIDDMVKRRIRHASSSSSVVASSPSPRSVRDSATSVHSSSPPPPPKKQKATLPGMKKQIQPQLAPTPLDPVSKSADFKPAYIGSFLVPNAWSTCKGRGWVKAGEEISVRRNDGEAPPRKTNPTKPKPQKKVPGKQLKLTSMMNVKEKGQVPTPLRKNKPDNVVRFTNSRGFGEWSCRCSFCLLDDGCRDREAAPKCGIMGCQTP
jgi:DNA repair protein RAD5